MRDAGAHGHERNQWAAEVGQCYGKERVRLPIRSGCYQDIGTVVTAVWAGRLLSLVLVLGWKRATGGERGRGRQI